MKSLALVAAAALAAATFAAQADPGQPGQPAHGFGRLQQADTNHDGMISREEAAAALPKISQHFDEIDANHDGQISADEWMGRSASLAARSGAAKK